MTHGHHQISLGVMRGPDPAQTSPAQPGSANQVTVPPHLELYDLFIFYSSLSN